MRHADDSCRCRVRRTSPTSPAPRSSTADRRGSGSQFDTLRHLRRLQARSVRSTTYLTRGSVAAPLRASAPERPARRGSADRSSAPNATTTASVAAAVSPVRAFAAQYATSPNGSRPPSVRPNHRCTRRRAARRRRGRARRWREAVGPGSRVVLIKRTPGTARQGPDRARPEYPRPLHTNPIDRGSWTRARPTADPRRPSGAGGLPRTGARNGWLRSVAVELVLHLVDDVFGLVLDVFDHVLGLAGGLVGLAFVLQVRGRWSVRLRLPWRDP